MAGTRWRRSSRTVHRRTLRGALVLGRHQDDEPLLLTGPGADVWDMLEEPVELDDLVDVLKVRYVVDERRILSEIAPLLEQLREAGLVERL